MSTLEQLRGLDEHLSRWVADGVITASQADLIVAEEEALAPPRRTSLVTEALGYVGGVLVVVASVLLAARFWSDLSVGGRLGVVGTAAVGLLAVGAAMPALPGTPGERLRSVTWVMSSGALAFFLGLLAVEVLDWRDADVALFVSTGTAVYGMALWFRSRFILQQAVLFAALSGAAAAAVSEVAPSDDEGLLGLGILAVAVAWLVLGLRGVLQPRRLVLALGGLGALVAAVAVQPGSGGWGSGVAVAVVVCLVGLALLVNELVLLAVGTVGMFLVLPPVLTSWFPGAVAAPLVLLVCGAVLVLVALKALRAKER